MNISIYSDIIEVSRNEDFKDQVKITFEDGVILTIWDKKNIIKTEGK